MGVKSFIKNWKSTIVPILITAFALLFFAIPLMLANYNQYDALAADALKTNDNYYIFAGENIKDCDREIVKNSLGERHLINYINYDFNGISGIVEVPQEGVDKTVFGQEILYFNADLNGELFGEDNDKIMITDYLASKIINNSLIVYNALGEEYAYGHPFTTASIANGTVYLKLGISPNEGLNKLYAITAIVGTDWEENFENANLTEFKYNMIYAPVGFVENNFEDSKIGNVHIEELGGFQGRVINSSNRGKGYSIKRLDGKSVSSALQSGEVIVSNNLWVSLGRPQQVKEIRFSVTGSEIITSSIVGYYENAAPFDRTIIIEMNNQDYFDNELHVIQTTYPITKLFFLTENVNNEKLAEIINRVEINTALKFESENADSINEFSAKINLFKTTFSFFAIFSLLLSIAFLYNHITSLIERKKKDIGIYRSLGARSSTVFVNLFTTVGIIAKSAFVLSAILSFISYALINSVGIKTFGVGFSVATFSIWHLLVMFLTCLVVAVVATFIPVFKYSNQAPVKQIK